ERSSPFSVWTASRITPLVILPSYRLASDSGTPAPTSAPPSPPTVAPPAAPGRGAGGGEGGARRGGGAAVPGEPAERSPHDDAGASASGRALGRLAGSLMGKIPPPGGVREQHRHVVVRETCGAQVADDGLGLSVGLRNAEHGFLHVEFSSGLGDVELIHDVALPGGLLRHAHDSLPFAAVVDRSAQRDAAIRRDDLHVLGVGG